MNYFDRIRFYKGKGRKYRKFYEEVKKADEGEELYQMMVRVSQELGELTPEMLSFLRQRIASDKKQDKVVCRSSVKESNETGMEDIKRFISVVHTFETDVPQLSISFGKEIVCRFFDCDNTAVCIYKNMLYRGQVDDEGSVNKLIRKAIHADEMPVNTKLNIHFDDAKGEYDWYTLILRCTPQKGGGTWLNFIYDWCIQKGFDVKKQGSSLHLKIN